MLLRHARSLLFLPASNKRAIAKARTLPCDMVILDLEDAVPNDRKEEARTNAVEAAAEGFGGRLCAVRINVEGAAWHGPEMVALKRSDADYVVLPKVESLKQVKEGDVVALDYADGITRILHGSEVKGTISGEAFSRALGRIWLGERAVQAGLKKALLGG